MTGTQAGLTQLGGLSYGTSSGVGAVFSLAQNGTATVVHAFTGPPDGYDPLAGLIRFGSTLYGTTLYGGTGYNCANGRSGCGTVYSTTVGGAEKVLYSFSGGNDGSEPDGLVNIGGVLYGATGEGGTSGFGVVFKLTLAGRETVLYNFLGGVDGYGPSNLINVNGTLYGTTGAGGGTGCGGYGCGTVFSVTTAGVKTVLYTFKGGSDGAFPSSALLNVNGVLYGTTSEGGGSPNCTDGCGTIYKIVP